MRIVRCIASVMLTLGLVAPNALAAGNGIVITGSTTVLPVMQKVGEEFMALHPDIVLSISGGGSGNGIKALNDGLCDIAMSSRDLKDGERHLAARRGLSLVRTTIALDALAPVVHPDNRIDGLSDAQLRDIYAGRITNWKEVGGEDAPIVVISRDSSSGTFETWAELMMRKERVMPGALLQPSNGAVAQAVADNRNAIGYIGFGYLNRKLKALRVNGKTLTTQTATDGTWPIARELYLFTNGEPAGDTKRLIAFLLDPQKGQKAVAAVGYIPLQK